MSNTMKKQLVEVARLAYSNGMVNTHEGNISVSDGKYVYITPSGTCKGFLNDDTIAVSDIEGNTLSESKPSSELKLHLAIYRNSPGTKSVFHSHCPYATAFAIANKPIETKAYPELITLFGKIPLAAYGTPSTDEIYHGVLEYLNDYSVILLANHGIVSMGKDVYDAFFKLEAAESVAKALILARQLGGEKELPADKLEELYRMRQK